MKGDTRVLGYLNKVLTMELTSINQYFLHARMFKSWGLGELDKKEYKKSIKDMKQADDLIERIFFLEGLPNLQNIEKLRIGEDAEEMLKCDLELQMEQLTLLCEAIAYCETQGDYVSRELLEGILTYEEEHVDWIETQQELLRNIGSENYLQSQM